MNPLPGEVWLADLGLAPLLYRSSASNRLLSSVS
jgi:hypothetical protein